MQDFKKKIKVLHVLGSFHFGGIERLVLDLITAQIKSDAVSPSILVIHGVGEFSSRFAQVGAPISAINPQSTYHFSFKQLAFIRSIFKSTDIIHFHGFHLFLAILAAISFKRIIFTEHGNFGFGRKLSLTDLISLKLRKYFYKWCVAIIACNSKFTKQYLESKWGLKGAKYKVVYNGSNIDNVPNHKLVDLIRTQYANKYLIGTISRLAGFKEIPRLVKVFKDFHAKRPDTVLIIVGEGPERSCIEKEAGDYLNKSIFLTGYKVNVADYQMALDICVFPSKNEPFGLVALEAYNLGKPVIVFNDGGGLTEIVTRCEPKDIVGSNEELLSRLNFYYLNRNNKLNTSDVREYFSLERMINRYNLCYNELICVE